MWKKKESDGVVAQAQAMVPGFKDGYQKFEQYVVLKGLSDDTLTNYGRNVAHLSLHFVCCPEHLSVEEINGYLYHKVVDEKMCESGIKHTVFGVRKWLYLHDKDDLAIRIPIMKKSYTLPEVLSKEECKELFKAPKSFKHRFLLAFTYSTGMRLNEVRFVKISDLDTDRMQVRIHQGKGKRDRYVVLSEFIKDRLPNYLESYKPEIYLFEGNRAGHEMGERSIQNIMTEAVKKTNIKKKVSLHTLRHSYATHLLEEGVDLYTIQKTLGHQQIRSTIMYLHIAQVLPKSAKSPLDTLYIFRIIVAAIATVPNVKVLSATSGSKLDWRMCLIASIFTLYLRFPNA
jgi:site-specific recombinase XerD